MLSADGLNPGAADNVKLLFDTQFSDYCGRIGARNIGFGRGYRDDIVRISP